jgi:hypothetical protein
MENRRFLNWAFGHYLEIAHPRFAGQSPATPPTRAASLSAA